MPFSQFADKVTCAYCNKIAPVFDWPRSGDYIAFCHRTRESADQPGGKEAFSLRMRCPHCLEIFYVVWDSDPR